MEIGESVQETAIRKAREEAGITIGRMDLFGICSGMDRLIAYPNEISVIQRALYSFQEILTE